MLAQDVKAGSELDIMVAERVMGWTRWADLSEDCPCEPGVTYFADWGEMGGVAVYTPPHLTGDVEFYFEPSSDIKDAWKVVEKMRAAGWIVRVQEHPDGLPFIAGSGWRPEENLEIKRRAACLLTASPALRSKQGVFHIPGITEFGETAPVAICLAALRAAPER